MPGIDPKRVPRLTPGVDLVHGKFNVVEGRLLALVDGQRSAGEILSSCGLPRPEAEKILLGLHQRQVFYWFGEDAPKEVLAAAPDGGVPKEPWLTAEIDPRELGEPADLDEAQKRKIIYLHQRREALTHYQILGVPRRAQPAEIKKAYFTVSKEFHPDTYFRKNLGTFKPRIEALFKRVTQAYEVLGDPQKRAAYDQTLPYEPTPEELAARAREELLRNQDERLAAERRERLVRQQRRRSPKAQQEAAARAHYDEAMATRAKDPSHAYNAILLALSLDPDNEEYRKLHDELKGKAGKKRGERDYRAGLHEESVGNLEGALKLFLGSIDADPNHWESRFHAARLMLALHREEKKALAICREADLIKPDHPEVVETLAALYEALDMLRNALREYERFLRVRTQYVEPDHDPVPRKIKELRRRIKDGARDMG